MRVNGERRDGAIGVALARRRDAVRAQRLEHVVAILRARRGWLEAGSTKRELLERRLDDFGRELDSLRSRL